MVAVTSFVSIVRPCMQCCCVSTPPAGKKPQLCSLTVLTSYTSHPASMADFAKAVEPCCPVAAFCRVECHSEEKGTFQKFGAKKKKKKHRNAQAPPLGFYPTDVG